MTATDANSPQGTNTGIPGTALPNGLGNIAPSGADLVSTEAVASSAGTSGACSAVASVSCANAGASQPLTVDLSLSGLLQQLMITPPVSDLPPGGLGNYNIVLSLTGPAAACTAGPEGGSGSGFTATQTPASGTVDITNGSSSAIGGPQQISGPDVLSGLPAGVLSLVLQLIPSNTVDVTFTAGSTSGSGSGPASAAAAGQLALQVGSTSVLSLAGGKVSCGPNQQAPTPVVSSSSPVSPSSSASSSGSPTPSQGLQGATSTPSASPGSSSSGSSEIAMHGGIQSDEGRYVPASDNTPLWAGLVSGGVVLAGGIALWRRRLRRS